MVLRASSTPQMKRAAGRPKDLIEVEVLAALRNEIDRQG
jgi:hypothetical protein